MLNAKLTMKSYPDHQTIVRLSERVVFGGTQLVVIGGPCAVESQSQMETVARMLAVAPVQALRGGVYKPRTSRRWCCANGESVASILTRAMYWI